MAKLLEDAAAGRYKRAVDPAAAAATSSEGGAEAAAAPDSKQLVLAELSKASAKHDKLVEVLRGLQQQLPSLQDDFSKVLLHAAATSAWLQSTAAGAAVH
jgi:hypothetical protein